MASLTSHEVDDVLVVTFNDAKILDEAMIQQIGNELMEMAAQAAKSQRLVLDFRGVEFMSSAMIGKLVLLNKKAQAEKIDLRLCEISPNVLEVFKILRLNKVFTIEPDLNKAVKSFDKKGWFG